MSIRTSPVKKALKSAFYHENEEGKKVKKYIKIKERKKYESSEQLTGSVGREMRESGIYEITVHGVSTGPMGYRPKSYGLKKAIIFNDVRVRNNRKPTKGRIAGRLIPSEPRGHNSPGVFPIKMLTNAYNSKKERELRNAKYGLTRREVPKSSPKTKFVSSKVQLGKGSVQEFLLNLGIQSSYSGKSRTIHVDLDKVATKGMNTQLNVMALKANVLIAHK